MEARLASTSEAAVAVGVSTRSLARWAQDGVVEPEVRTPGGHLKWDVAKLRQQLRNNPQSSPATDE